MERGEIGMKLEAGEIVYTSTGRETTPFPKIDCASNRKAINTLKRIDNWLILNAIQEAESRCDNFNLSQFLANTIQPNQADKDSAELYLFGDFIPPVVLKPILKKLI